MADESMVRLWPCCGGIDAAVIFCGLVLKGMMAPKKVGDVA